MSFEEECERAHAAWLLEKGDRTEFASVGYASDPRAAIHLMNTDDEYSHSVGEPSLFSNQMWADDHISTVFNSLSSDLKIRTCLFVSENGPTLGDCKLGAAYCDLFTVIGHGHSVAENGPVLVIRSIDSMKNVHTVEIPRRIIALGDRTLASHCADRGFTIAIHKADRLGAQRLLTELFGPKILIPDRTGWLEGERSFLLPTAEVIGERQTRVYFDKKRVQSDNTVATRGKLESWQSEIKRLVPGNSRFELALCTALASPLMQFNRAVRPTIFNVYGESSLGKSTAGPFGEAIRGGNTSTPTRGTRRPTLSWRCSRNTRV